MSLTQKIQEALASASLSADKFILASPDANGGVTVTSPTDDYDDILSARDALQQALPVTDYMVLFARTTTNPSVYVGPSLAKF